MAQMTRMKCIGSDGPLAKHLCHLCDLWSSIRAIRGHPLDTLLRMIKFIDGRIRPPMLRAPLAGAFRHTRRNFRPEVPPGEHDKVPGGSRGLILIV